MASSDVAVQQVARQILTDIDALDTVSEIRQHGSADPVRAMIVAAVFILGALVVVVDPWSYQTTVIHRNQPRPNSRISHKSPFSGCAITFALAVVPWIV